MREGTLQRPVCGKPVRVHTLQRTTRGTCLDGRTEATDDHQRRDHQSSHDVHRMGGLKGPSTRSGKNQWAATTKARQFGGSLRTRR